MTDDPTRARRAPVGRHEVTRFLSEGGMGALYLHRATAHAPAGHAADRDRRHALRLLPSWPRYDEIARLPAEASAKAGAADLRAFLASRFAPPPDSDF